MSTPVVLITGALTGIGRAAALAFAKGGSRVVISGRHEEAGQALATELRALGAEAEFVRADVRHEDAGVPLQRTGEPDEIANAIVFLASSKSSFTTAQVLFVDGGKSAT